MFFRGDKKRLSGVAILSLLLTSIVAVPTAQATSGCNATSVTVPTNSGDAGFGGGVGTSANPWQICSVAQLRLIDSNATTLDGNYILKTDLNVTESTISSASSNGTTVTFTTATPHPYKSGDFVTISGMIPSAFNLANEQVTVIDASTFSVAENIATSTSTAGGAAVNLAWQPIASSASPFTGVLDGSGYAINAIRGSSNSTSYKFGLFHTIGSTGEVRDLSLSGSMVSNQTGVSNTIEMGLLASAANGAFVKRINVTSVTFEGGSPTTGVVNRLGSIFGVSSKTVYDQIIVNNLLFKIPALASNIRVGGLAGTASTNSDIKRVRIDGEIRGVPSNRINSVVYMAGVVADFQDSTASQVFSSVDFTNPAATVPLNSSAFFTGGIFGSMYIGTLVDAFVEVSADRQPNFGGISGQLDNSSESNSINRTVVRLSPTNLGPAGNPAFSNIRLSSLAPVSVTNSFYDSSLWNSPLDLNNSYSELTDFSGNGTTVTYTTLTPHGLEAGDIVHANGMVPSEYGLVAATVFDAPTTTTFRVTSSVTGARVPNDGGNPPTNYTGRVYPKDSRGLVGKTTTELRQRNTYASWTIADPWASIASDQWFYAAVQGATTSNSPRTFTTTGPHSFNNRQVSISGAESSNYNAPATAATNVAANQFSFNASPAGSFSRMADAFSGTPTYWKQGAGELPRLIWLDLPFDTELKFHPNYTGAVDSVSTKRVSSYPATVGANPFTRSGFALAEWNTLPDGTGEPIAASTGQAPRSINLYAQWRINDANKSSLYDTFEQPIAPSVSARPGDTIWASAIEKPLSRELFTASIQAGQTSAAEEYAYRITRVENDLSSSLDAQGSTGYTTLTKQQQEDWYTSLGYSQQYPYKFSWSAFLCVDNATYDVSLPTGLTYSYGSREKGILANDGFETSVSVFYNDAVSSFRAGNSPSTRTLVGDDRTVQYKYLGTPRGAYTALGVSDVNGTCGAGTTLQAVRIVDATSVDGTPTYLTAKSLEVPTELSVYTNGVVKKIPSAGVTVGVTGFAMVFNAALWGLTTIGSASTSTPAAPSVPYLGPLNVKVQNQIICSGSEVVLTGQRLDTIAGVEVGTKSVGYQLLANGNFKYSLKDVLAGRYQVKLWVPVNSLYLTNEIVVGRCDASSALGRVNVGSFNGKLVVYAAGLEGKRISWKVGGRWGRAVANSSFARFDRPTPRRGVEVNVEIFVDGVSQLTKRVVTR